MSITERTTYTIDLDFVTEATSSSSVIEEAMDWLAGFTQELDSWTVSVPFIQGPGGGWPVVRFGHRDRDLVEGLLERYEGME